MHYLNTFVIFALLMSVSGFEVTSNVNYYTTNTFEITCGNVPWNKTYTIAFYWNKHFIFFDSHFSHKLNGPFKSLGEKNASIIVQMNNKKKSFANVGCIAKDLTKKPSNRIDSKTLLTIPYASGKPVFKHTPEKFKLNTAYTLICEAEASVPITITFMHESNAFATLKDGIFIEGTVEKGLKVEPVKDSKNSIMITPSIAVNKRFFSCSYTFLGADGKQVSPFESPIWNTNGTGSLTGQLIVVVASVITAIAAQFQ